MFHIWRLMGSQRLAYIHWIVQSIRCYFILLSSLIYPTRTAPPICQNQSFAQMSAFLKPDGLGKERKVIGVTANLSGSQYATSADSVSVASPHRQSLALAPSIIFCISLHLGISPEQDAVYVLVYALLAEAAVVLKTPGAGVTASILTTVAGLGTAWSLLAHSLLSFKSYQATTQIAEGESRPMFFPVQTSHTRLFPKVHSLSYPFMWTGIPIGLRGNVRGALSVERKIEGLRPAWFTIDSCDYMSRGSDEIGLDGKLHDFLLSQVIPSPRAAAGHI